MVRFLFHFSQAFLEFRRAEWKSICNINGLQQYEGLIDELEDSLIVMDFECIKHVQVFLDRCVLLKSVYELLHVTDSHEGMFDWLRTNSEFVKRYDAEEESWCLRIRSVGKKRSSTYVDTMLKNYIDVIEIDNAAVNLVSPTYDLSIIEYVKNSNMHKVYFVKYFGKAQCDLKTQYGLKNRRYIGNSTMDPLLSFLQANMTYIKNGDLTIDPFCGTGGLLISAANFGAFVIGGEINYAVARAYGKSARVGEGDLIRGHHSILANFQQYGLEDHFVSVVLADASQKTMWKTGSLFDAIITDPPYGIREKGRKLGVKEKHKPVWTNNDLWPRYPEKEKYALNSTYTDLMDFAAEYLRIGGHVSYWYPILRETYSMDCLPQNDCLELIHNCEQSLNRKCSRRLLVYRKIREFEPHYKSSIKTDSFDINSFRDVFMSSAQEEC